MPEYECIDCHKKFNLKGNYLQHLTKKKKCIENEIYECPECHKIYKYKSDYDRHEEVED